MPPIERFGEINNNSKKQSISVQPKSQEIDSVGITAMRPQSFGDYIGQSKLKTLLNISIQAAKKRQDPGTMGHLLLHGRPGLGKTSIAMLIAQELGTKAHILSAPALEKPRDIVGVFMSVQKGDIVFIDEIHRLNKLSEELLYPVLEDFVLDLSTGKASTARINRIPIPRFIMVGATTELGRISSPLLDRFIHTYQMELYTLEELQQIVHRTMGIFDIQIDDEASMIIAGCSRGIPRIANRLAKIIFDYATYEDVSYITADLVHRSLKAYDIDENGLDSVDRDILRYLISVGRAVGIDALSAGTAINITTIEERESYMLQEGLILRTPKGRISTPKASEYLDNLF